MPNVYSRPSLSNLPGPTFISWPIRLFQSLEYLGNPQSPLFIESDFHYIFTLFQRYNKPNKIKEPLQSKVTQRLVNLNPFFVCMYLQRASSVNLHYLKWQPLRVSKQNFWQRCSLWKYYLTGKIYLINHITIFYEKTLYCTALLPNPAASSKKFGRIKLSIFMTILKYLC